MFSEGLVEKGQMNVVNGEELVWVIGFLIGECENGVFLEWVGLWWDSLNFVKKGMV
ncbi:hypothetical protein [Staphylococcus hominis]|uniref:hypothetical protein n=1 Tax=Staphylococcus hominis TaxID=1290 RepID=UPI0016437692|nr:hypothetical protein [Staphylococcus hominis]